MAQTLDYDVNSLGGMGGMGGFGGNNPLLWLITLGFLKGDNGILGNGNAGAGVLAGETQAKLDCLAQQHSTLMSQIAKNDTDQNFTTLGTALDSLAGISRDGTAAVTNQINDFRQQVADCCCDLKSGQQSIKTDIASQTSVLLASGLANTQNILDKMCANEIGALSAENARLQSQLNKSEILEAIALKGRG